MSLRFGTDGVRGVANRDLTPELVVALGRAAARVLGADVPWVVGRDTRRSGTMLEAALVAGLAAEGADSVLAGVVPTPAVAWLAQRRSAPAAMISASHNPFADNGVKLFSAGGRKLADAVEQRLEAELVALLEVGVGASSVDTVEGRGVGVASRIAAAEVDGYVDHLLGAVGRARPLEGMRIVVDCGHGAASTLGPRTLEQAGADVRVLNAAPDGTNINDGCGSTDVSGLRAEVLVTGADAGLAFDGDADRIVGVDERGEIVDGDHILGLVSLDFATRGLLPQRTIVTTVMANLGLRRMLAANDIGLVETPVGDRYVLEAMDRVHLALGGEQSGHVIFADHATTGDGILTGLIVLDVVARAGRPFSEVAGVVQKLPQVLLNVRLDRRDGVADSPVLLEAIDAVTAELGETGRVLVRASGTEPVVRVMVEAPTAAQADTLAARLAAAAEEAGGSTAGGAGAPG